VDRLRSKATFAGKRREADLPASYNGADLFLFPTIEDGFAVVLAQAKAAALPILTTPHSAGLDLVTPGQDGWIVPVRQPAAIVERLSWCSANRPIVARVVKQVYDTFRPRDWNQVATHFESVCVTATTTDDREPAHV
jgi:glycosyltransferase involved in cell wall biosynthesis